MTSDTTCLPDQAVQQIGLLDTFILAFVARCGSLDTAIPALSTSLGIGRNRLRSALHRLVTSGHLTASSTTHTPRSYQLGPRAAEVGLPKQESYENARTPKIGVLNSEDSQNRSPKTGVLAAAETPQSTAEAAFEVNPGFSDCSTTTLKYSSKFKNKSSSSRQAVLIKNENAQNLGALDIEAQQDLKTLGIQPNLKQRSKTAPNLAKAHTPAEILMFHDHDGDIAANLAAWRMAWSEGADITATPALIWIRIVEGQRPPEVEEPERREAAWLTEARERGLILT